LGTVGRHMGLAFVCAVVSCLALITFTSTEPENPIEILGNDYPRILSLGRSTFSFSVMAREQLERLELRFIILTPRGLRAEEMIDPDRPRNASGDPAEVLKNVRKLGWFEEINSNVGILPHEFRKEISIEGSRYQVLVRDYSDALGSHLGPSLLGGNVTLSAPLVFAAVANETRLQYLEGTFGFFVSPEVNLKSLLISHNERETKYVSDDEVREDSPNLPISRAPKGIIALESLDVDDTITVSFGIEPLQFDRDPQGPVILLQMIQVYLDGEAFGDPILNVVR
jgi:hypothetical protein